MPLSNNYKCDGQMSFFECLDAMRGNARATESHEKQSNDKLQGLQAYGVLNRKIRGQRTYAYYNPNPIYTLDGKPYVIFGTIAYIDECELYVKEFGHYPKILEFKTAKETVDAYKEYIAILTENIPNIVKQEVKSQLPLEEFYMDKGEWICESRYNSMYRGE